MYITIFKRFSVDGWIRYENDSVDADQINAFWVKRKQIHLETY